jgi:uncharacterized protein DUF5672
MKPNLHNVSLVCVDTNHPDRGAWAIAQCLKQCDFGAVKLFTTDEGQPHAVKIGPLHGIQAYCNFCIRDLWEYIETDYLLVVQYDGFILNGAAWSDEFLKYDYIGAPWHGGLVGNGGFALRSRRLMEACSRLPGESHPEDQFISRHHRRTLEGQGLKFAPVEVASRFALEAAGFNPEQNAWFSDSRKWSGEFGFHSYLTPLPGITERPKIFHHSGDLGDIIYSLATVKALGGGVLYLSPDNRSPYPGPTRLRLDHASCDRYSPFFEQQPYVTYSRFTPTTPASTDYDLNLFRQHYRNGTATQFDTLFQLHARTFNVHPLDETQPWLKVDGPRPDSSRPIVINRTARYRNPHFPWRHLIQRHGNRMLFVGLEAEYQSLRQEIGVTPAPVWVPTPNLTELARIIAGAKFFIGNQSTPMALALGLGVPLLQECWQANPNTVLRRPNAIYWGIDTVQNDIAIPEKWLTV